MQFYAHSNDGDPSGWQPLEEHLQNVANLAAEFAKPFGGDDPCVGYLHAVRPGRPSLALDLMEEFRAFLADRLVLSLINRRQIQP